MFDWHKEKAVLQATLASCIRQGLSYKEATEALEVQFQASCTSCIFATQGHTVCRNRKCYIEEALNTYLKKAKEKLN